MVPMVEHLQVQGSKFKPSITKKRKRNERKGRRKGGRNEGRKASKSAGNWTPRLGPWGDRSPFW
jgi:hypothetical protein